MFDGILKPAVDFEAIIDRKDEQLEAYEKAVADGRKAFAEGKTVVEVMAAIDEALI